MGSDKFHPKVSIIIPVYNGSKHLNVAIDSALNQTYSSIEIIVVNDGSCDNDATKNIALSYGDKIRYIHKENGGVSSALNEGIRNMTGEYFSWLSHDDMYHPEKIEKQVRALENTDENTLALCAFAFMDKNGNHFKGKHRARLKQGFHKWNDALCRMYSNGTFNGCALLVPKNIFDHIGNFDETLKYSQDSFMWMNIFLNEYNVVGIDEVLVYNRIHDNQLTQTGKEIFHSDSKKISQVIIPKILTKRAYTSDLLCAYASYNAKHRNKAVVEKCLNAGSENKLLSQSQILKIRLMGLYGAIRPIIRKLYYKIFKKVKTQ